MERWAIYIDIQGFGARWEKEGDQGLLSLGQLMLGIARIGQRCFPDSPDRLFAYQFGDGFLIISDFHEDDLERCVSIAIALLRHVSASGLFASAAIVEGEIADIMGCYPTEVLDGLESDLTVALDMGLMTIVPVMGTALIRGVRMEAQSPSGPLLLIDTKNVSRLPKGLFHVAIPDKDVSSIDWIHFESDWLSRIQKQADIQAPSSTSLRKALLDYLSNQSNLHIRDKWKPNIERYLRVTL